MPDMFLKESKLTFNVVKFSSSALHTTYAS